MSDPSTEEQELPDDLYAEITRLSELGNEAADDERYEEAIREFTAAWELLPEPKYRWEAALWLLASLGDMEFSLGAYDRAYRHFQDALKCEDALGNPFIWLRRGQALLELGDETEAADSLMRAYLLEGEQIFADEDPTYFRFLRTRAQIDGGR